MDFPFRFVLIARGGFNVFLSEFFSMPSWLAQVVFWVGLFSLGFVYSVYIGFSPTHYI